MTSSCLTTMCRLLRNMWLRLVIVCRTDEDDMILDDEVDDVEKSVSVHTRRSRKSSDVVPSLSNSGGKVYLVLKERVG